MRSLQDTLIVWNPGTAEVALCPWPMPAEFDRFECAAGAGRAELQGASFEERQQFAHQTALALIIDDKCEPAAVHRALSGLDEYAAKARFVDPREWEV